MIGVLKKAVDLNELLISEDQMKLQAAFKKGWEKFGILCLPYIR